MLLVRGSGYTSKVEPVWASLCSALSSQCTSCPRDDSLLCALTPLLEVALGYSRGQVHDRAVHLWQSLFARSPSLHVQPRLRLGAEKELVSSAMAAAATARSERENIYVERAVAVRRELTCSR
ncbi:hypothetical protein MRX96_030144 [Rhipicephalus microplus]